MSFSNRLSKTDGTQALQMMFLALISLCVSSPAFAQGGMGGAVVGIVWVVLGAIGIVALLLLLVIGKIFGRITVGIILLVGILLFGKWSSDVHEEFAQRKIDHAESLDQRAHACLSHGAEKFNLDLTGKEKISLTVVGKEKVPDFQSRDLLIDLEKLPNDFSRDKRIQDQQANEDEVDVVITYDRPEVAGSWWTKIDISVIRANDGAQIAHRKDLELRQGFCLGPQIKQGMNEFIRKALNRPDFMSQVPQYDYDREKPFHHVPVVAKFDPVSKGRFLEKVLSNDDNPKKNEFEELLTTLQAFPECIFKDSGFSNYSVTCLAGTSDENSFNPKSLISIVRKDDYWLAIFRVFHANTGLGTILIEQRDLTGKPLSAWLVNFKTPQEHVADDVNFKVTKSDIEQQRITLHVVWNYNSNWASGDEKRMGWFENQSIIRADLVGLH